MPSVDDPRHAKLERDVTDVLKTHGFLVGSATYHSTMDRAITRRLQYVDTPTALYLRTRADRFALHSELPICFEWEAKTAHPKKPYETRKRNCSIEAYPLAQHMFKAHLGVRILYCYRDEDIGLDVGFWCDDVVAKLDCLMMTSREQGIRTHLKTAFPRLMVNEIGRSGGSNDPFVLISEATLRLMDDWRMEIANELHKYVGDAGVVRARETVNAAVIRGVPAEWLTDTMPRREE